MIVEFSDEARQQVRQIDTWWRENRPAAPDLFVTELDQATSLLGNVPSIGVRYEAGSRSVRRLLLRRTQYHVYFVEEPSRIFVVAVWSVRRGHGPEL